MKRYLRGAAAVAVIAGGLGAVGCTGANSSVSRGVAPDGCGTGQCGGGGCGGGGGGLGNGGLLRSLYDPCWPERYNAVARDEVLDPFRKQVNNGMVMHHTIWNWYFEADPNTGAPTDRLNPAGMAKLDSIVKERPAPDPRIFIQTARDLAILPPAVGVPGNLETVNNVRTDLDARRAQAVQRYLAAQPGLSAVAYEFYVHDPVDLRMPELFAGQAFRGQITGYRGGLTTGGGAGVVSTGGGTVIVPGGGGNVGTGGPR
jgi:hypothetical protein